ncbi:MAG: OmpH family outer membrane protein [Planctomycetota bacterium]|nr:OmpH family outer membrane protein [Planctomycetota bacterium]
MMNTPSQLCIQRLPKVFALVGCLALAGSLLAGMGTFAPQPTRVAVVDVQRVFNSLEQRTAMNEKLTLSGQQRQAELDKRKDALDAAKKQAELLPNKESAEYREALSNVRVRQAEVEAFARVQQQLIAFDTGDTIREIYASMLVAIEDFAKREGYDVVLVDDRDLKIPAQADGDQVTSLIASRRTLFASDAVSITDRIITKMNNDFNAGSGAKKK